MAKRGRRARWAVMAWALVASGGACKGRAPGQGTGGPAVTAEGPQGAAQGPEVPFVVQADSLDVVELVMEFEDSFGLGEKISEEEAAKLTTVGSTVDYLIAKLG